MSNSTEQSESKIRRVTRQAVRLLWSAIVVALLIFCLTPVEFPWHHVKLIFSSSYRAEVRRKEQMEMARRADYERWIALTYKNVVHRAVIEIEEGEYDAETDGNKPSRCIFRVKRLWQDNFNRIVYDIYCEMKYPLRLLEDADIDIYSIEIPDTSEGLPAQEQDLLVQHGLQMLSVKVELLKGMSTRIDTNDRAKLNIFEEALANPVLMHHVARPIDAAFNAPRWGEEFVPYKAPVPTPDEVLFGRNSNSSRSKSNVKKSGLTSPKKP